MRRIITCLSMAAAAIAVAALPAGAADDIDRPGLPQAKQPVTQPEKGESPAAGKPKAAPDLEYVVQEGDTLAGIAERKLGEPSKWQVIARANGIDDPRELRVGQKLKIPGDQASESSRTRL